MLSGGAHHLILPVHVKKERPEGTFFICRESDTREYGETALYIRNAHLRPTPRTRSTAKIFKGLTARVGTLSAEGQISKYSGLSDRLVSVTATHLLL